MSQEPKMSKTTKDLLSKVQKMVPPMLEKFHKGDYPYLGGPEEQRLMPVFFQVNWVG